VELVGKAIGTSAIPALAAAVSQVSFPKTVRADSLRATGATEYYL